MKIGILTHSTSTNYGANLQSLSTAYYLKNHGYEPLFFNWNVYMQGVNGRMNQKQVELHISLLKRHGFHLSEPCYTSEDFRNIIRREKISNLIIGSDAVLTVKPFIDSIRLTKKGIRWGNIQEDYRFPNPFWANFIDETTKINLFLMSPSCQSSRYELLPFKTKQQMSEQLHKFCFLSARDIYTQKMICDIAQFDPSIVPITPDPVWNFNDNVGQAIPNKNDLLSKYHIEDDNYILVSFYACFVRNKQKILDNLSEEVKNRGYKLYFLPMPQDDIIHKIKTIPLPIDSVDYYSLIKYSKGYIGNNMHPVICSIHNQVPFVSIDQHGKWYLHGTFQNSKSSKVLDLLSRFNLTENRIDQVDFKKKTVDDIMNMLEMTNVEKMKRMSMILRAQYMEMMNRILELF